MSPAAVCLLSYLIVSKDQKLEKRGCITQSNLSFIKQLFPLTFFTSYFMNIKNVIIYLLSLLTIISIFSCQGSSSDSHQHHTSSRPDTGSQALSPNRMAMANIGDTHVHIEYSAPSVRDRIIWGGLVGYNRVWVTGAHMATSIEFDNDILLNGHHVKAGKYAFFTIPTEDDWTIILNENWNQHLADDYDEALDVLRFSIKPEAHEFTEQLTFEVRHIFLDTLAQIGLIVCW